VKARVNEGAVGGVVLVVLIALVGACVDVEGGGRGRGGSSMYDSNIPCGVADGYSGGIRGVLFDETCNGWRV